MRLPRRRFADLVRRQLDLFAAAHADRLDALRAAYGRADGAERGDAEEAYGDYADQVDWAAEDLLALRDAYEATLDEAARADYRRAFTRAARRRFGPLGDHIAHLDALDEPDDEE